MLQTPPHLDLPCVRTRRERESHGFTYFGPLSPGARAFQLAPEVSSLVGRSGRARNRDGWSRPLSTDSRFPGAMPGLAQPRLVSEVRPTTPRTPGRPAIVGPATALGAPLELGGRAEAAGMGEVKITQAPQPSVAPHDLTTGGPGSQAKTVHVAVPGGGTAYRTRSTARAGS